MKLTLAIEVDDNVTLSTSRVEILWAHKGGKIIRWESESAANELIQRAIDLGFIHE